MGGRGDETIGRENRSPVAFNRTATLFLFLKLTIVSFFYWGECYENSFPILFWDFKMQIKKSNNLGL
jgi:hypothetical protein